MNAGQAAGYSVRQTSRRLYGEAFLSAVCSLALFAAGLILGELGAQEVGGLFLIVGLLFAWDAWRRRRMGTRFKVGAIAEERVGSRLWKLEKLDWLVEHDVPKGGGGNIDHLVQSPAVTFVIETKAGGGTPRDIAQALQHAEWARRRYGGQRAIVPVLCLQHSKQRPELVDGVCRVGASHLVSFMLDKG
jgi:hypothetical protein